MQLVKPKMPFLEAAFQGWAEAFSIQWSNWRVAGKSSSFPSP
jgi:hypothetical protein